MDKQPDKVKVLYIAGNGRSGTTLIDLILGQLDGFFTVGELRGIWDWGFIENVNCGCGLPFKDCDTWQAIVLSAFEGCPEIDARQMVAARERWTQIKSFPRLALRGRDGLRSDHDLCTFLENTNILYQAISQVSRCRVIVDASKSPTYGYLLDLANSVDLYVLHLVRDPRAVAYSWMRLKEGAPGRYMPRYGPFRTSIYWLAWNWLIRAIWDHPGKHYYRLTYEQFVTHPRQSIERIVHLVGEDGVELPFLDESTVNLSPTHGVGGNIDRGRQGALKIKADDAWRSKLSQADKLLVTGMTWPFFHTYGYKIRG